MNPWSFRKGARGADIALANRLPTVSLTESGGADLPAQAELFIPGGRAFRDITRHSAAAIPTVAVVFGNATAGGAYVPGMSDYIVMIEQRSKVFLGGPPLVKMATGEESTDEELGGASMHARVSGLADYLAVDEVDAIRLGRQIVRRLNWRKQGPGPTEPADDPVHDPDELLGHRLGRPEDALRPPRGAGPGGRRLALRRVQAALRHQPGHGVGLDPRLPDRGAGQPPRRPLLRGGPQGHPVHPAGQPDRRPAPLPPEHHRATWWARSTSSAASSSTGRR